LHWPRARRGLLQGALPAHAANAVVLYGDGLENLYRDVLPAFEKEGVKVNIVTAGSGEVVNRANIEKNSPKADVIVTLPPFIQQAGQMGLLQPYQSVNYKNVPAIAKARTAWATFVNNYFSFAINPDVVKNQPKTFADLLSPSYAGKVAYSNPATAGDGMAVLILTTSLMGEDKAFDYLAKLSQSVKFHTKGTGYLNVLLSRNEISVANGDLQMDLDDAEHGALSVKPIFLAAEGRRPADHVPAAVRHRPDQERPEPGRGQEADRLPDVDRRASEGAGHVRHPRPYRRAAGRQERRRGQEGDRGRQADPGRLEPGDGEEAGVDRALEEGRDRQLRQAGRRRQAEVMHARRPYS
jgi:2-aminoethylphosphonate ABC transporter binding protein